MLQVVQGSDISTSSKQELLQQQQQQQQQQGPSSNWNREHPTRCFDTHSLDFARILTSQIKATTHWQQLERLLHLHCSIMNPIHISALVSHLPKVVTRPKELPAQERAAFERFLGVVSAMVLQRVEELDARALSNILWAAVSAAADVQMLLVSMKANPVPSRCMPV